MYTHTHTHTQSSGNKSPRAKKMGYRRPDVQSTFLTTVTAGIGALRSEDWSPVTFPPSLWMATEISALWSLMCKQPISRPRIKGRRQYTEIGTRKRDKPVFGTVEKKIPLNPKSSSV